MRDMTQMDRLISYQQRPIFTAIFSDDQESPRPNENLHTKVILIVSRKPNDKTYPTGIHSRLLLRSQETPIRDPHIGIQRVRQRGTCAGIVALSLVHGLIILEKELTIVATGHLTRLAGITPRVTVSALIRSPQREHHGISVSALLHDTLPTDRLPITPRTHRLEPYPCATDPTGCLHVIRHLIRPVLFHTLHTNHVKIIRCCGHTPPEPILLDY